MKYEHIAEADLPAPPRGEKAEADTVIAALVQGPVAIDPGSTPERNLRRRLAMAARRAGVHVISWYDKDTERVYARLAAAPAAAKQRKAKAAA